MHKLSRKKYGKEVAGVCAGLAEYYDLPVRNVRFAFVFFSFCRFWCCCLHFSLDSFTKR